MFDIFGRAQETLGPGLCFTEFRRAIITHPEAHPEYSVTQNLVLKRGCIWLLQGFPFIQTLLMEYHSTPTDGHMRVAKTLAWLTKIFYWLDLRKDVERFVATCINYQHTKYETKKVARLLCPLPMPCRPWEDLSLDFITGLLPPFHDNTTILVFVYHFSNGIHLGMLAHHHTSHLVAVLFMDIIGKLQGMSRSLLSDRDPLFVSHFWQDLFRLSNTQLRMSSAYHLQMNGQTEVLNRAIE